MKCVNRYGAMLVLLAMAGAAQGQGLTKNIGGSDTTADPDAAAAAAALVVEGHKFYFGADYADATLSVSNDGVGDIPSGKYTSKFIDLRAGYRVFNAVGIEVHYGIPGTDASADGGRIKEDEYYAIFAVPTASVFSAFELSFPLGYTHSKVRREFGGGSSRTNLDSVAFGVNIEVPVRVFWDKLPDVRLTGGGLVYNQKSDARYYGFHYGLRYDFGF